MPELIVPLKDIIVDAEQNSNLTALPADQALDQLKKCYVFLSPSVAVRIEGDTPVVTFPIDKPT